MEKMSYAVVLIALVFLIGGAYAFTNFDIGDLTTNDNVSSTSHNVLNKSHDTSKDISNKVANTTKDISNKVSNVVINTHKDSTDSKNNTVQNSKPVYRSVNGPFTEDDIGKTFIDESGQEYVCRGTVSEELYNYRKAHADDHVPISQSSAEDCVRSVQPLSEYLGFEDIPQSFNEVNVQYV